MADRPPSPDPAELLPELEPADGARLEPPDEVWTGIERAVSAEGSRRRRFRTGPLLMVAAVVALLGAAGILVGALDDDETVLAEVTLTDRGLPLAAPADARAALIETDGEVYVDLDLPELEDGPGFYEAWLIDRDVEEMYSLGPVDGSGRLAVPSGVDPGEFPIIDLSVEPLDGDPTHSGRSVLRGTLPT